MRAPSVGLVLLLVLAPAVSAQEPVQHVHLGVPDERASHHHSVVWYQGPGAPVGELTLSGPDGDERVVADMVSGPTAGIVWEAHLEGLTAATNYTYTIGDRASSFRTPSTVLEKPLRIVALGDMGVSDRAAATADLVDALKPDLVLHAGDISYAEGAQPLWHQWFEIVEPVASRVPWLTALGNHEVGPLGVGNVPSTEPSYYQQRFSLPHNELWYSVDFAGVHIIALDTFSDLDAPSDAQADWLRDDLSANRDANWTIVFLHEPAYSSNNHGSSLRVQQLFVPIFDEYGVDLVIAGHDHAYERTFPLRGGEVTSRDPFNTTKGTGTVYVVTGGAGEGLYDDWTDPAPDWSAARQALYHVTELIITQDTLHGTVVPTLDDTFRDTFAIHRPASETTPEPTRSADSPFPGPPAFLLALAAVLLLGRIPRNFHHTAPGRRPPGTAP